METKPRILCVDDEPNVLEGLQLNLRRKFTVATAGSAAAALEQLARDEAPIAIVSDMRMPGMDGATFLARARALVPDAVRLLLTGQADMQSAIAAINDGQIFRFLTKPCPAPSLVAALDAAVEQHRLITAERVLLEQTLAGCVKTLTEVLALTNPVAFGRASRLKRVVSEVTAHLGTRDRWQVEVAAMLSQLGAITLPPETAEKLYFGRALSPDEHKMVQRLPAVTEQLLGNIPRLERVRTILTSYTLPPWRGAPGSDPVREQVEHLTAILRAVVEYEALEAQGSTPDVALDSLRGRGDRFDPAVLAAMTHLFGTRHEPVVKELRLAELRVGMVLAEDCARADGMLLLARGVEISAGIIERFKNMRAGMVREPIRVVLREGERAAAAAR